MRRGSDAFLAGVEEAVQIVSGYIGHYALTFVSYLSHCGDDVAYGFVGELVGLEKYKIAGYRLEGVGVTLESYRHVDAVISKLIGHLGDGTEAVYGPRRHRFELLI